MSVPDCGRHTYCSNFQICSCTKHTSWCFPCTHGSVWGAGFYLNKSVNLQAGFSDASVIFFHPLVLILHGKQALPFPIFSLKYWRHPCFHDALNLFHVVFGFLNPFFKVTDATGDLNDIIPNACSPKETELTEVADSGIAKGLAAVKDRDPIRMGF